MRMHDKSNKGMINSTEREVTIIPLRGEGGAQEVKGESIVSHVLDGWNGRMELSD